jgi:glycyl-tRNA synthetase beta chain
MPSQATTAPLLIELGCEEIPASSAPKMATALRDKLVALLDEAGLAHGKATMMGTPRRLTAHVADVQLRQPDRVDEVTGPPAKVAFDADGKPTRAGEGFARGQGMSAADLYKVETPKGAYAGLRKEVAGLSAAELIAAELPGVLRGLPQPKRMRWAVGVDAFIRPVRWLVALLGDTVVEAGFAGVQAGRKSRGHRFDADVDVQVSADLAAYVQALGAVGVEVDPEARSAKIVAGARALAEAAGGTLVQDQETIDTITWLVEQANPLLARFDDDFLAIPDPVILTTLKSHQKLLCVRAADPTNLEGGALLPCFVAVANTLSEASKATVADGNCKVVSARLSDARFFYTEDGKKPLSDYIDKLAGRTWLHKLGTVADKVDRIGTLATAIGKRSQAANMTAITRGARLCKADLSTRMVGEFPSLQGVIGADYARRSGEPDPVALVIEQHYLPRFAGDALPASEAASVVALVDRLDSIVGCFGINLVPTGAQDPYALRRAALGVLHILAASTWQLSLSSLLCAAIDAFGDQLEVEREPLLDALTGFFRGRLKSWHQGSFPTDIVDAVLEAGFDDVSNVQPRIEALSSLRSTDAFEPLAVTFKRVGNIVAKAENKGFSEPDPTLFQEPAEAELHAELLALQTSMGGLVEHGAYGRALALLSELRPTVDRFFDDVMVMAEDPTLQRNRLALMHLTGSAFAPIADFRRIQGSK